MSAAETASSTLPSWDGVWIVIPAYNEVRTVRALAIQALALCARVIVVDDGSTDGTVDALHGLSLTRLAHPSNQGKAASLRTAFRYAVERSAKCVISIDGDGQHDLADAAGLLQAWHHHPQRILIGSRLHDRAQFPPARYRANQFACFWISWAAGHPIADSQSGFRVYPLEVMRLALTDRIKGHRFTFESEILIVAAQQGYLTMAMAIPSRYPANARASHFRPIADIAKIVVMVAGKLLQQAMAPMGLWRSLKTAVVLPGRQLATALPLEPAVLEASPWEPIGSMNSIEPIARRNNSVGESSDLLLATKLVYRYPGQTQPALAGVGLTLKRGQAVGLLGPNGSGKSTLITLLIGLRTPQDGHIQHAEGQVQKIAWVPQEYAFYPELTCRENLEFFADMLVLPSIEALRRVEAALVDCMLQEFSGRRARHCSGGVKRRLNFGIALLQQPDVLLLDEPTAGVDPQSRAFLLERVKELVDGGTAVLYATHHMEEVSKVCSHILLLDHGKVLASGSLKTLLQGSSSAAFENLEALFMHYTQRDLRD